MKTLLYIIGLMLATTLQCLPQDSRISAQLSTQLAVDAKETGLNFPGSVKRFYIINGFHPAWIRPQDGMGKTWQAMLILDCVLQFGLAHSDYHPYELSYDSLHIMMDEPEKLGADVKARFDIILTDAMISLMNHLHYGKFNPDYTTDKIDRGQDLPFVATNKLREALLEKDLAAVLDVQPKTKLYRELQTYMQLVKGQYAGDCYEVPEDDVRLVAINMERLRWAQLDKTPYIHVNIPSYTLNLHEADSVYTFKTVVGRATDPTPTLRSAIGFFTAAPDWKVPQKVFTRELLPKALKRTTYFDENNYTVYDKAGGLVNINSQKLKEIAKNPSGYTLRQSPEHGDAQGSVVFRFPNDFDVYLHDSPDQKVFNREVRSLSKGSIRVQNATELAVLLLRYDDSSDQIPVVKKNISSYLKSNFRLKTPVPISITYITCAIKDGELVRFKDIYHLDKRLEVKLYNITNQLVFN